MQEHERRAQQRFPIQLPIVIRSTPGEIHGVSRDVSAVGVFFYTDNWPLGFSPIEFRMILPAEITGTESIRVVCKGTVVRLEDLHDGTGVAATIDYYVRPHTDSSGPAQALGSGRESDFLGLAVGFEIETKTLSLIGHLGARKKPCATARLRLRTTACPTSPSPSASFFPAPIAASAAATASSGQRRSNSLLVDLG